MIPAPSPATGLNPAQRAAVERWNQDVCVVAGPGSGKTRVLIERFRWLIEHKAIHPRRILAVTFTEKAATEIKKRLISSFSHAPHLREEIERAWVSTIHGFCTRLLKENAIAAQIDPDFTLLDEAQATILQRQCADAILDDLYAQHPAPLRDILRHLDTAGQDLASALLHLYEEARSAGVPIHALQPPSIPASDFWTPIRAAANAALADPPGQWTLKQREAHLHIHTWARRILSLHPSDPWQQLILALTKAPRASSLKAGTRARLVANDLTTRDIPNALAAIVLQAHASLYPFLTEALRRIHTAYSAAKRRQALLDFEDLQESAIRLLESDPALQQHIRDSFDQVLMDELQDTNRLQWRLIDLVRKPDSLFAVGDINQSIYFFRHADPSVFRDYRDSLIARGAVVDELRENYRSRATIIEAVNSLSPFLSAGVEPHLLTAQSEYPQKSEPSLEYTHTFAARPDAEPARTEAYWIANRIRQIAGTLIIGRQGKQRPARYSDIAVLARTVAALTNVQQALDDFGIPSQVSGGRSFYETREVRDLLAWLSLLANPNDEISLVTVLRSPFAGASDDTILLLKTNESGLLAAMDSSADPRVQWLARFLHQQRRLIDTTPPATLLSLLLDATSYTANLNPRARANISKFLAIVRARTLSHPGSVGQLHADLLRFRDTASEAEASAEEVTNSVRLMSVHAAKGLEFPIVFIAALRNGAQNREPVFCFDSAATLGASWRHPAGLPAISDPTHLAVCALKKRQEAGEEDRLLYVAATRAEEHLVCTAAPGGKGKWASQITDALLLFNGVPKEELHDTSPRLVVTHTARLPQVPHPELSPDAAPPTTVILSPPSTPLLHDSVVPVTSVAQHAFCPRQYYLARFLGLQPQPAAPSSIPEPDNTDRDTGEFSASQLGVLTHDILAGKPAPDAPPEALQLADSFRLSPLARRLANATRAFREYDFLTDMEGMILRGQIDLWFEENGELILLDYKTDQVHPGAERRHSLRYQPQLRLYALALQKLTGRLPDRALLWYLRTSQVVEVSLDPDSLAAAQSQVRALRDSQSTLNFPTAEGPHCLRCGFFNNFCPSTFKESTPDPNSPA